MINLPKRMKLKELLYFIRENGLNLRLFKLKQKYPKASISKYAILNIQKGHKLILKKGCIIGDYTKICVDDNLGSKMVVGENTYIGDLNNIRASGGDIIIGNDCLISQNVLMVSSNHEFKKGVLIRKQPSSAKRGIYIGNDVWIGGNSVILPGVHIGDGAVIGGGTIVTKDIPPNSVVAGNPAKFIKFRE